MSRGKLIFPFRCVFACLDTESTEAEAAGAGYDHDFHEPVQVEDGTQLGYDARAELQRAIRCQIEPMAYDALRKYANGDSRTNWVTLVSHFSELERLGFVDAGGNPMIRVNDRLAEIREDTMAQSLLLSIPATPGLYVTEVKPIGFGLGKKRNLVEITLKARPQGK
jgi:hypothetical protein